MVENNSMIKYQRQWDNWCDKPITLVDKEPWGYAEIIKPYEREMLKASSFFSQFPPISVNEQLLVACSRSHFVAHNCYALVQVDGKIPFYRIIPITDIYRAIAVTYTLYTTTINLRSRLLSSHGRKFYGYTDCHNWFCPCIVPLSSARTHILSFYSSLAK